MKKRGFIPINTNWFDRLFIGVISYVAFQLFWMRFFLKLKMATPFVHSAWIAAAFYFLPVMQIIVVRKC